MLRLKYKTGEVLTYHLVLALIGASKVEDMPAINSIGKMDYTVTQTVKSVDPKTQAATIDTDVTLNSEAYTVNGRLLPDREHPKLPCLILTSTLVVEPDGKVDSLKKTDNNPFDNMPAFIDPSGQMGGPFSSPDTPVKVGDAWNRTIPGGMSDLSYHTSYQLRSLSSVKGDLVAALDSAISGNLSIPHINQTPTGITITLTGNQSLLFDNTIGVVQSESNSSYFTEKQATDPSLPSPPPGQQVSVKNGESHVTENWTLTLESYNSPIA